MAITGCRWDALLGWAVGRRNLLPRHARIAGPADASTIYQVGVGTFLICIVLLMLGRRIERTLELLNWVMVVCILGAFLALALYFVPASTWAAAGVGFFGFDLPRGRFSFMPGNEDYLLLAALAGYSGAGGMVNIALSSWARDKGYGMGQRAGTFRKRWRAESEPRAHGLHLTPHRKTARGRGGAHRTQTNGGGFFLERCWDGLTAVLYVHAASKRHEPPGIGLGPALASRGHAVGRRGMAVVRWCGVDSVQDAARHHRKMVRSSPTSLDGQPRASALSPAGGGDVRVVYTRAGARASGDMRCVSQAACCSSGATLR